jgi:hypothetical protein
MTNIPQDLIKKALALTGKTMKDMNELKWWLSCLPYSVWDLFLEFSSPKFFAYLLSLEFIEEYTDIIYIKRWYNVADKYLYEHEYDNNAWQFGKAIRKFQSWNPNPLISLLSNIW